MPKRVLHTDDDENIIVRTDLTISRNNASDMPTRFLYNNVGTTYITNNKSPTMVVI